MHWILIFSLIFCVSTSFSQNLPSSRDRQPNGISIYRMNYAEKKCLPLVFIGKNNSFTIACYNKIIYKRKSISNDNAIIKHIRQILTFEFLRQLKKCGDAKNCPDTVDAYHLQIKNGKEFEDIFIDISMVGSTKCGNAQLDELIKLYKQL